jgi:hypothetical protein
MSSENEKVTALSVLPNWPGHYPNRLGDPIPAELCGAKILRIGGASDCRMFEGGGLLIDYETPRGVRRIALAFNECGMWVESLLSL